MCILKEITEELNLRRCSYNTIAIIMTKFVKTYVQDVYSVYSFQNEVYTIVDIEATMKRIIADVDKSTKFYRLGLPDEYLTFEDILQIFTEAGKRFDENNIYTTAFNYFESFCFVNKISLRNEYIIASK